MILTVNGGSSSIKFALYSVEDSLQELLHGELENIDSSGTLFSFNNVANGEKESIRIKAADHHEAAGFLIDWLQKQDEFDSVTAIGHRIVHGMQHTKPAVITTGLLDDLKKISAFDPDHLPE